MDIRILPVMIKKQGSLSYFMRYFNETLNPSTLLIERTPKVRSIEAFDIVARLPREFLNRDVDVIVKEIPHSAEHVRYYVVFGEESSFSDKYKHPHVDEKGFYWFDQRKIRSAAPRNFSVRDPKFSGEGLKSLYLGLLPRDDLICLLSATHTVRAIRLGFSPVKEIGNVMELISQHPDHAMQLLDCRSDENLMYLKSSSESAKSRIDKNILDLASQTRKEMIAKAHAWEIPENLSDDTPVDLNSPSPERPKKKKRYGHLAVVHTAK